MDKQAQSRVATIRFSSQESDFLLGMADKMGISFGQAAREAVLQCMRDGNDQARETAAEARLLDAINDKLNENFGAMAGRLADVPQQTANLIREAI